MTAAPEPTGESTRWPPSTAAWVVPVVAGVVALLLRSAIDDAYISFRYSKNLVDGYGLVFNPGERVEGYTNFAWTVLMALPIKLGISVTAFADVVTAICAVFAVRWTMLLARAATGRDDVALWAGVLITGNVTFLCFATSGLETMPQTAVLVGATLLVVRSLGGVPSIRRLVGFSALATLALLLRLDSAVVLAPLALFWMRDSLRAGIDRVALTKRWLVAVPIPAVVIIPWFVWKHSYYGEWVPNTFFAKEASSWANPMGVIFLGMFVVTFLMFLPVGAIAVRLRAALRSPLAVLVWILVLWCAYVVYAGGDWMDFRFMVAVMPPLFVLIAWAALSLVNPKVRAATLVTCLIGGVAHFAYPGGANIDGLSTVRVLTTEAPPNWVTEGKALHRYFPGGLGKPDQVVISVVAAGAIPYFSDLPAIDMVGLTDAYVARHGHTIPYSSGIGKPGHLRMAPVSYLRRRRVNLVIGLPVTRPVDPSRTAYHVDDELRVLFHEYPITKKELGGAKIVEIPVDAGRVMLAVYLTPHPEVERHIQEDGWRVVPIV